LPPLVGGEAAFIDGGIFQAWKSQYITDLTLVIQVEPSRRRLVLTVTFLSVLASDAAAHARTALLAANLRIWIDPVNTFTQDVVGYVAEA
jgi:hypothetical protein